MVFDTRMQDAIRHVLYGRLEPFAGVRIRYVRNNVEIPGPFPAVPGDKDNSEAALDEVMTSSQTKDWLIHPKYLMLGGGQLKPMRGDLIIWDVSPTRRLTFIVTPQAGDRPYDWSPNEGEYYRVHSKLIEDKET